MKLNNKLYEPVIYIYKLCLILGLREIPRVYIPLDYAAVPVGAVVIYQLIK